MYLHTYAHILTLFSFIVHILPNIITYMYIFSQFLVHINPSPVDNTWVEVYTVWTYPMPLMEAMLRFMEHKVKKSQFSVFVAIGFIYRFVLVQKL